MRAPPNPRHGQSQVPNASPNHQPRLLPLLASNHATHSTGPTRLAHLSAFTTLLATEPGPASLQRARQARRASVTRAVQSPWRRRPAPEPQDRGRAPQGGPGEHCTPTYDRKLCWKEACYGSARAWTKDQDKRIDGEEAQQGGEERLILLYMQCTHTYWSLP
jgi:hypothetical protein